MREITPHLTQELEAHCKGTPVWRAPAFQINKFRTVVEHVARLAYANPDELLFFRGQGKDYQSRAGGTTLYPAIYRTDPLPTDELKLRFATLDQTASRLVDLFKRDNIDGHRDVQRKRYIQWSILQHYEVLPTPLLDLTQSLRVACSFAQLNGTDPTCYVYVLGLPYFTNRISINSEHDVVTVRLLSICPPTALRPYFQEGFLSGTSDLTVEFDSKTETDFRNRLIAKFAIPRAKAFWGPGFEQIPRTSLYPPSDRILELCNELRTHPLGDTTPWVKRLPSTALASDRNAWEQFIMSWNELDKHLLNQGRRLSERNLSLRESIALLRNNGTLTLEQARELDALRRFRNAVVHHPETVDPTALTTWLGVVRDQLQKLRKTIA